MGRRSPKGEGFRSRVPYNFWCSLKTRALGCKSQSCSWEEGGEWGVTVGLFFIYLSVSWGTVPGGPQPLSICRPPARTQGSGVLTMPERGSHLGPLLMWGALLPRGSENILLPWTKDCCPQVSRKRGRPSLSLLHPLGAQPGKGSRKVQAPLKSALTEAKPGRPRAELGPAAKLVFLLPVPPLPDPVRSPPSIPCGSYLAQSKSNPLTLHNTAIPTHGHLFPPCSPLIPPPQLPRSPCCPPNTPGTFQPQGLCTCRSLSQYALPQISSCLPPSHNPGFCPNVF